NQANADYIFLGHALQGSHDGLIDEVKVYHEALSADQIYQNYLAGFSGRNNNILMSDELSEDDEWLCEVTPNDGYVDGTTKNATAVTILSNNAPTWVDDPVITPASPTKLQNLTCNFNVTDVNGDSVINITNWYKNNVSTTLLYMPFEGNGNEANNATDYSGYGNNGTVFGATWNRTGGKVGGAYEFDGSNDYVLVSGTVILEPSELTISVWFNMDEYRKQTLIEKDDPYSDYTGYEVILRNTGTIGLRIGNGTAYSSEATVSVFSEDVGNWVYYVGTYNGTDLQSYRNGVAGSPLFVGNPISYASGNFYIGIESEMGEDFNGTIDEVKIYNFTLSPEQIWADYLAGLRT
ncbi:MAG: LamG domain-containing protein, partial [Nanoarchaeota archaeon]|nr:LamG domain-containing protein [Nanoarchaeota archaeon]